MPSGLKMRSPSTSCSGLPPQHLEQAALHVDRDAVLPAIAGIEVQRHLRQPRDELLVARATIADLRLPVGLVDKAGTARAIDQTRGVAHQVLHRHRPRRVAQAQQGLPSGPMNSVPTFMSPIAGRNFDTGSVTCRRPSSTICISAVLTIGLVIE